MDIESDSDTWEDFFGSTTELAPSLLGFYDTLTNSLAVGSATTKADVHATAAGNQSSGGESTPKRSNSNCSSSSSNSNASHTSHTSNTSSDNLSGSYALDAAPQTPLVVAGLRDEADGVQLSRLVVQRRQELGSSHSIASSNSNNNSNSRRGNNIRVLSPNVQRIIAHADAEPVNAVDIEALQQQQQQQQLQRSPTPVRYVKATTAASTPPKLKLSHLPLSKITGKLSTQSGSDLVSTLDASSDYSGSHRRATPVDEDRTPTNKAAPGTPFHFEGQPFGQLKLRLYELQQSIKLSEMEQLAVTSMQLAAPPPPATPPRHKAFVVASEPLSPEPIFVDTINFDLVAQHIDQLTLSDLDLGEMQPDGAGQQQLLVEAINKPLIGKPLVRSVSAPRASLSGSPCSSPLQTYARTKLKSQSGKASTLGGGMPLRLPTAEQLAELEEANKLSAESLDTLTDIKPKYPARLRELTRLNNRPLSSSSICSTSSSSSSGSDQLLNGKLAATSYLASVESLAESENELGDHHHHHHHHPSHTNPMSVLERACLEIVDSERSFVEDLGQVIKGYLLDWKERACLRLDELQILFANIEEIYEFNSMLLQQLINSGMEPGKIAKCFINLRERFNVYTTYCTSYPEAISLLTKLLQAKHTNSLLASTQKLLQHRLPLGSYLLKPVQRILKYHLLLDSLRKHCDVKEVAEAYAIMRQVAHHIDQVKRQQEQQSRVKELSGILDGWMGPDLSVLRELRHEGLLMEQHNKPRQVLLFETMLIITKQKEDGRLQFKSLITQKNLMLSEHLPGEPTSFYVIPFDEPRNQIKLTARNRDQKRIWTQHIKGVMLEELDIPTRAKELVYQLGNEEVLPVMHSKTKPPKPNKKRKL
ncbi:myosin-M heavy chain isoform X2 [Drosophila montana]|uniref:myosin-M heavy chain isoform X2 n=1 Tax=Drosophila montana TaxID=40370 RepID=UPI00313C5316